MLLGWAVIIFVAWSFLCGFRHVRGVPGARWYQGIWWGFLAVCGVTLLGMASSQGAWEDQVAQVVASVLMFLIAAGLGTGIGWFFRPPDVVAARRERRKASKFWPLLRRYGGAALAVLFFGGLAIGLGIDWWYKPDAPLQGVYKISESSGFGNTMRGAFFRVGYRQIEIRGPSQPLIVVPFTGMTRAFMDDGRVVIPNNPDMTWRRDAPTKQVEVIWPAFGKNRKLLLQPSGGQ